MFFIISIRVFDLEDFKVSALFFLIEFGIFSVFVSSLVCVLTLCERVVVFSFKEALL